MEVIDVARTVWHFVYAHLWTIIGVLFILIKGKEIATRFIYNPLAGADGKVSMPELAQAVVIVLLIWAANRDGYRQHEWAYFSEGFYFTLIAGLFSIAAIKPVTSVLKYNRREKPTKDPKTETKDEDNEDEEPYSRHPGPTNI